MTSSTAAAPAHIASAPVNVKNMNPLPRSASTIVVGGRDHADRHVAAAEALAAVDDVGLDREVLVAPAGAGAAEPGHHLVGDEQDVVAPADLGDGAPVVVGRREAGAGGAGDRLEHEGGDRVGPSRSIVVLERRGVVPRDVGEVEQHRLEALAAVGVAADGEGAERQAVVARVAADDLPPLRAAARQVVGAGEADRRVGRLAAAAREEDVAHARRAASARRGCRGAARGAASARSARRRRRRPCASRTASAISARPWPMLATIAPPAPSRMRRPSAVSSQHPSPPTIVRPGGPGHEVDAVGVATRGRFRELFADDGRIWPACAERSRIRSSAGLAGEAEDALAEDVAHHVRRAAHDRVAGRVARGPRMMSVHSVASAP